MTFLDALQKAGVDEEISNQIMTVDYVHDPENPSQDTANFFRAAMQKCDELLEFDKIAEVMFYRSCCKSGYRLSNAKQLAKEHGAKPLEERLSLLGTLKYMGKPTLTADREIMTVAVGSSEGRDMSCPCWNFKGCRPVDGAMPLSYCLCCAGHFRFHYQKALNLTLRAKQVVSSMLNSEGRNPCVFVYEIVS